MIIREVLSPFFGHSRPRRIKEEMRTGLLAIIVGLVVYIVSNQLIAALVTGTTTGDTLIQTLVPIAIAVGVVLAALGVFMKTKM